VGESGNGSGGTVAVLWDSLTAAPAPLQDLNASNPSSSAYFINSTGIIVGESRNNAGQYQAVAWIPGAGGAYGAPVAMSAVANQIASVAFGIDGSGNIVGEAELDTGAVHGILWSTSGAVVANTGPDTSIQAVANNRLVGYRSGADNRATMWNRNNTLDNKSQNPESQAYGVNNTADMVGVKNGKAYAWMAR
jgi:hypothetical protein